MVTDEKQPAYEVLDYDTEGKSFRYLHHEVPISEEIAIHFHPELEINWIVRGYGMRIVGTCHEFFSQGEMVFMPGSMPHCWIYDPESCGDTGRKESHVCQLSANILLHACIIFPELKPVVNFLLSLRQAYLITGSSKAVVCQQLLAMVEAGFQSDNHMLMFPAGLCSRKINGKIHDIEWKKTFVTKSVQYQRDVVPIHFGGQNSDKFYRIANICKALHLKFNVAMLFLVDEMYKNVHKTFRVAIGKPIPWQTFDKSKTPMEWAQYVEDRVYQL